ncbi:MAG: plasmid pRiA4b ORF-3 family protein [Pedosphaera sp.]|nr:plasmid pRiA4b ORF-3 family protein [Pedosphaera sp.]
MISAAEPTAGNGNAPIYQLKVVLLGSAPPVWRRLQVPGDATLDWLHAVLQVAIGWTNSHLHAFMVGADRYSDTRHHFASMRAIRKSSTRASSRSGKSLRARRTPSGTNTTSAIPGSTKSRWRKSCRPPPLPPPPRSASMAPAPVRRKVVAAFGATPTCSRSSRT